VDAVTTKAAIDAKLDALQKKREKLEAERDAVIGRTLVKCSDSNYGKGCGKKTAIKNIVYIRTHWYVSPYGCTGGDYWNEGEGQFICPKCGNRNRLTDSWGEKGREKLSKYQRQFKSIVEEHDR
jgi:hypothetical protein